MRYKTKRVTTHQQVALNDSQEIVDARAPLAARQEQVRPQPPTSAVNLPVTGDPGSGIRVEKPVREIPAVRMIRRHQLREIVPLSNTTIYEMERRGSFPKRIYITSRCVAWDLREVEAWIEARRRATTAQAPSVSDTFSSGNLRRRNARGERE